MATVTAGAGDGARRADRLSGTPRAHAVDRWIYVFMAASFIVITLTGFIPDSLMKIAMVEAGARPPFPLVMHMHAVLMGSFLLLLLAQTTLVATGRNARHVALGRAAFILAPALVLVGVLLVPTNYHSVWSSAHAGPPEAQNAMRAFLPRLDNIMLLQLRVGLLFPLFLYIGLKARRSDPGLHKRMMILATAVALGAAIDRMKWLPTTMPESPLATDLYIFLAVSPMFAWDLIRNRAVHRAWLIWIGVSLPAAAIVMGLWDSAWWHQTAPKLMGV
ncbi:MAG TPA: hypothetical protein VIT45_12555 [Allosphingosinicella sp.]